MPLLITLKVRTKGDSLWKRLTDARADGTIERAPLVLQRAATAQSHEAFTLRETHLAEKARVALTEQDQGTGPRAIRRLTKPPKDPCTYRRSHPSKQHRRQAVHVLEGVCVQDKDRRTVRVRGVGTIKLRDPVHGPVSSAQLVERKDQVWLHVQHGREWPEPKPTDGPSIGLDAGVAHTLTSDSGEHWQRPDTSALEEQARCLSQHRAKCCTKDSRQWKRLCRQASVLRRKAHRIHENWERHVAKELSEEHAVLGTENLELQNMTASGRGTHSLPGSRAKRGLNRSLATARLARLHAAVQRRALRDGTWCVAVDPRNTSITCSKCGHKDRKSRKGPRFSCTQCGFQIHADQNAGINLKRRAGNVLAGYIRTRGGGDRRPGGVSPRQARARGQPREKRQRLARRTVPRS